MVVAYGYFISILLKMKFSYNTSKDAVNLQGVVIIKLRHRKNDIIEEIKLKRKWEESDILFLFPVSRFLDREVEEMIL